MSNDTPAAVLNRARETVLAAPAAPKPTLTGGDATERSEAASRKNILSGNVFKSVFLLAFPSVATMLLQTTNTFLDRFFVGHLDVGPEAQAAIAVSSTILFALMAAGMAISVGTTALVARAVGENDKPHAEAATAQSLLIAVGISLLLAVPMWFLRVPLLTAVGLQSGARDLAASYLGVTIIGLPTLFSMLTLNGTFRGMGDTVRPFFVTLGANAVHASLNYCLIFGNFGFPKLGLPGGALALAVSQVVATGLYLFFLRRSMLKSTRFTVRLDFSWAARIAKIGLPAAGQQLVRVGSMLMFQTLLARMGAGDAAVAALGVGLVSESIAFMPGFGYSIAASAFVGQNLGAKNASRANKGAWAATLQAVVVMTIMGVVFWIGAEPFARFFVPHLAHETAARAAQTEQTVGLTISYLRTAAWSEPFLALGMVLTGALQGAGETVSPTAVTIATMLFLRVPLAYCAFRFGYGTTGAWWAMSLSTVAQGIATAAIFARGRWRETMV